PNNPVSCDGTAYPAAYTTERAARNMHISMNVIGVDLQPVPVPAAVYLFGSGLIGLAGMVRRKMAVKA
ncbi:MAG TPA: VPLPA-CTERM sorting domain-containing protein, partial [Nitrospira sp.]|nr:VPLPA-CTERM sorting domain-containing protein [Nitrospira sp.]